MKKYFVFITAALLLMSTGIISGCAQAKAEETQFHIIVAPEQLNGHSIVGQHCVFLVGVVDDGTASKVPVEISATAQGAEITIYKKNIVEGEVAEVVVIPSQGSTDKSIQVEITGRRGSLTEKQTISFEVVEGENDRTEYATELLTKFVAWLEANHPELGITRDTEWAGTMVSPQWLIVSHYLFFSEEWELHVSWHIMVAPYDWAKIDLRHRFDESKPSHAFEISSLSGNTAPVPTEIPETVWR